MKTPALIKELLRQEFSHPQLFNILPESKLCVKKKSLHKEKNLTI